MTASRRGVLEGAAALLLGAVPGRSAAQVGEASAAGPQAADWSGWTPLLLRDRHVLADARIDGRPARVVIDSGAGANVLERGFAAALGLRAEGSQSAVGVGGATTGGVAGPVHVRLGALELDLPRAVVLDLSAVRAAGGDFQAVLGRDLFEPLVADFDFAHARAGFWRGGWTAPEGAEALLLRPGAKGQRILECGVDGRGGARAVFDLGSGSALMCSRAFAEARGLLEGRRTSTWISAGVEGVAVCTTVTVDELRLGSTRLKDVPTEVYDRWETPGVEAAVGLPALERFRLATDYPRDRLWLLPDARAVARPFAKDRSGLACQTLEGGRSRVLHVARGGPGERGGWRAGEVIAVVRPVRASAAQTSSGAWGEAAAGTTYQLVLVTGEQRELTLQDYF